MRGEADNGMAKKVVIVVEVNSFAGTVLYWVLCMEESHTFRQLPDEGIKS